GWRQRIRRVHRRSRRCLREWKTGSLYGLLVGSVKPQAMRGDGSGTRARPEQCRFIHSREPLSRTVRPTEGTRKRSGLRTWGIHGLLAEAGVLETARR